jgi:ATP-binding cassette subfamily F protein 3
MEGFIERFRAKASKAKQAQSRVKALDKVERITRDPKDNRELGFQFAKPERTGRVIFELEDGRLEVGEGERHKLLLDGAEIWLERGEHVSLVGPNGTGKTTLIDALAGVRELNGGRLRTGHNLKVGYLSQHDSELEGLGSARTVAEAAGKRTGLNPGQTRALLGRFLFSGEEAEKPLDGLSGGERKRLSLAILLSQGANVLILDEPTNHLDLESREALEDALKGFEGALLLVTHDRALLDAVGTRTVALEHRTLRSYLGGWAEYSRIREERKAAGEDPMGPPPKRTVAPKAKPKGRPDAAAAKANGQANGHANGQAGGAVASPPAPAPSKNAVRQTAKLEKAVETAEAGLAALEVELAAPEAWASQYESAKSTARHTAAKRAVDDAYAALEAHLEKTDA